jgi:peptidoglycan/xylan/chitin deacetylase (PgdA/CDA1 family)
MRVIIKKIILITFYCLGVFAFFRWLNRFRVPILTYHGVLRNPDKHKREYLDVNFIDENCFQRQMHYLSRKYHPISLSKFVELLIEQKRPPKYSVVITFDDGFKNNYTIAYPILQKTQTPFAIFLTTGFIGSKNQMLWTQKIKWMIYHTCKKSISFKMGSSKISYSLKTPVEKEYATEKILSYLKSISVHLRQADVKLLEQALMDDKLANTTDAEKYEFLNWENVGQMAKNGVEFGSHTINHSILTTLGTEDAFEEINKSKEQIEQVLQTKCTLFSYPNGTTKDFNESHKILLKEAGYSCALTQIPSLNDIGVHPFELRRLNIDRGHDFLVFMATITGVLPSLRRILRVD